MTLAPADEVIFAFRRHVVCAASAGTGKTHCLTSLYVLLTLRMTSMGRERGAAPAIAPDRIVATTFSRDAAAEMTRRVKASLQALASDATDPPGPLGAVIAARADRL